MEPSTSNISLTYASFNPITSIEHDFNTKLVDAYITTKIIPFLKKFQRLHCDEPIPETISSFAEYLKEYFPERSPQETNNLYFYYYTSVIKTIFEAIFVLLEQGELLSLDYLKALKSKHIYIFNFLIENEGANHPFLKKQMDELYGYIMKNEMEKVGSKISFIESIQDYVRKFLFYYKEGFITENNDDFSRPQLLDGVLKFLSQSNAIYPLTIEKIEKIALEHYFYECADYIDNQLLKRTGKFVPLQEIKNEINCQSIFYSCCQATVEALSIDFPTVNIRREALYGKLWYKLYYVRNCKQRHAQMLNQKL